MSVAIAKPPAKLMASEAKIVIRPKAYSAPDGIIYCLAASRFDGGASDTRATAALSHLLMSPQTCTGPSAGGIDVETE